MSDDDAAMLCFAVRYCLGRQSYAPGLCCDVLRKRWPGLRTGDRNVILKDIQREIGVDGMPPAWMPADIIQEWQEFLAWADCPSLPTATGAP